ncbi:MAG: ABC transporter substrate-binding protein [Chloroflexota bacterium]|nr:ABC transporter substrate-binding protein [Chloroflexota bacterium]
MTRLDRDYSRLLAEATSGRLGRRELLRRGLALGLSLPAIGALLAACGSDDDDTDVDDAPATGTSAPGGTGGDAATATTGAGDAPTTATGSGGGSAEAIEGEVVLALGSEPASLDPHMITGNEEWNALYHIYDPLIGRDPDGALVPGLIESYEATDAEQKVWRLTLREGVTFHNGEAWTAEVLAYNFERIRDTEEVTIRQYTNGIDSWEVVDERTLDITISVPMTLFENSFFQVGIVPMTYTTEAGTEGLNENPVGTGPFTFVEWSRDEHIRIEANPDYWGEVPAVQQGLIRVIPEPASRVAALVSGEVHVIRGVSVYDVERIEETDSTQVVDRPGPRMWHLKMDTARETGSPGISEGPNPFVTLGARQALYHAIDIEGLIDSALQGYAEPASQGIASFIWGHNPEVERLAYDPDLAMQLLAEAGFPDGFTVRFDVNAEQSIIGEAIAGYLEDVGITVELNAIATSVLRDLTQANESTLNLGSWGSTMVNTFYDGNIHTIDEEAGLGRSNVGMYSNPDVDALIDQARGTFDSAEQEQLYMEVAQMAMADVAVVPLYHEGIVVGTAADVTAVPYFNEHVYLTDVRGA